jgi:RNase P protein component
LGVVTSKKIGGAVQRSRARRLLRESFRQHQHEFAQPVELVLVARNSIAGKKFCRRGKGFSDGAEPRAEMKNTEKLNIQYRTKARRRSKAIRF